MQREPSARITSCPESCPLLRTDPDSTLPERQARMTAVPGELRFRRGPSVRVFAPHALQYCVRGDAAGERKVGQLFMPVRFSQSSMSSDSEEPPL